MRRLIAVFLLFLLPLQFSWGVAATYCQHETVPNAQHFGHHAHQHADEADQAGDTQLPGAIDNDCGFCHAGCLAALVDLGVQAVALPAEAFAGGLSAPSASPPVAQPERPNWRVLA
ncbi:MAG TPA: hypothetical protein VF096_16100 [Azonexus sp.]